jgi:hypothetical protein
VSLLWAGLTEAWSRASTISNSDTSFDATARGTAREKREPQRASSDDWRPRDTGLFAPRNPAVPIPSAVTEVSRGNRGPTASDGSDRRQPRISPRCRLLYRAYTGRAVIGLPSSAPSLSTLGRRGHSNTWRSMPCWYCIPSANRVAFCQPSGNRKAHREAKVLLPKQNVAGSNPVSRSISLGG